MHPLGQGLIKVWLVFVVFAYDSRSQVWIVVEEVVVGYEHGMLALVDDDLGLSPVLVDTLVLVPLDEVGELPADVPDEGLFALLALKLHVPLTLLI